MKENFNTERNQLKIYSETKNHYSKFKYRSTKIFDGYSTCFRQWRADSHCKYLHGYSIEFKVIFVGSLDDRNWVCDFGCFKKNGIKDLLKNMFDHTTIVAKDDPKLLEFKDLYQKGIVDLRVFDDVGCEKFAEIVFRLLTQKINEDPSNNGRFRIESVECIENKKNSAIYGE